MKKLFSAVLVIAMLSSTIILPTKAVVTYPNIVYHSEYGYLDDDYSVQTRMQIYFNNVKTASEAINLSTSSLVVDGSSCVRAYLINYQYYFTEKRTDFNNKVLIVGYDGPIAYAGGAAYNSYTPSTLFSYTNISDDGGYNPQFLAIHYNWSTGVFTRTNYIY